MKPQIIKRIVKCDPGHGAHKNDTQIMEHIEVSYRPNGTRRVRFMNDEPSLTQQQFKDETDVNNIIKRYVDTGQITHLRNQTGQFADFSDIQDFHGMMDTVVKATEAFESLPAEVRYRFRNDPGQLIEFLQDENNYDEALKLGLVNKREVPAIKNNDLNDVKKAMDNAKKTKPVKAEVVEESPE